MAKMQLHESIGRILINAKLVELYAELEGYRGASTEPGQFSTEAYIIKKKIERLQEYKNQIFESDT